jgi:hypothetical protein
MADNNAVQLSQLVEPGVRKLLNETTAEFGKYAIEHGFRKPKKGEVLSKLIKVGVRYIDAAEYFNS